MQIDVQFNPAAAAWPLFRDATLAAEAAGFGAVWVLDHLAGVSMRGSGMLKCFSCLGALSTTTTTIGLGTLVANVWNREPGVLAVAAASICDIADRPLLLGLGAGTSPTSKYATEQHVVGATIAATIDERHSRVRTTLELIDTMFDPDRPEQFATFPLPRHRPTTLIGVNSVRWRRWPGNAPVASTCGGDTPHATSSSPRPTSHTSTDPHSSAPPTSGGTTTSSTPSTRHG